MCIGHRPVTRPNLAQNVDPATRWPGDPWPGRPGSISEERYRVWRGPGRFSRTVPPQRFSVLYIMLYFINRRLNNSRSEVWGPTKLRGPGNFVPLSGRTI